MARDSVADGGLDADWQPLLDALPEVTDPRGLFDYLTGDPRERQTPEILAELATYCASVPTDAVVQLPDQFFVPESLSAETVLIFLENLNAENPEKYQPRGNGVGGRSTGTNDGKLTHIIYQLGHKRVDGGLLDDIKEMRRAGKKALRDGKVLTNSAFRKFLVANAILRWMKEIQTEFAKDGISGAYWHFVFYLNVGSASIDVHLDGRLKDELARRAIMVAPSAAMHSDDEERLAFYLAQEMPQKASSGKKPIHVNIDRRGARCLGTLGGSVMMTGAGAGGVPVIPAGVVDLSGNWGGAANAPAVYLWHVPYPRGKERGYRGMRGSYVFSGTKRKRE